MLTRELAREEAEPQASPASLERSLRWQSHCHTSRPAPRLAGRCQGPEGAACPEDPDALSEGPFLSAGPAGVLA